MVQRQHRAPPVRDDVHPIQPRGLSDRGQLRVEEFRGERPRRRRRANGAVREPRLERRPRAADLIVRRHLPPLAG